MDISAPAEYNYNIAMQMVYRHSRKQGDLLKFGETKIKPKDMKGIYRTHEFDFGLSDSFEGLRELQKAELCSKTLH